MIAIAPASYAAQSAQRQPAQSKLPHPTQTLQTVVVTVQRRSQNEQNVPATVTALDAQQLHRRGIENINDLSGAAPSLMIDHNLSGLQPTISIRGNFNNEPALATNSPVGIYVNGVYYGKAVGSAFNLPDIENIQILNGPQGTLYGQNAYAGIINFTTHTPTGIFNGVASATAGSFGASGGKVAMDLPSIGKLKVSLGGRLARSTGWFHTTPGSAVSHMNNTHDQSAFVDALYDVTSDFSIEYRIDRDYTNQYPNYAQVLQSNILEQFGVPGITAKKGRKRSGGVNTDVFDRLGSTSQAVHAKWKLGRAGLLEFIYGRRLLDYDQNVDLDGTAVDFASSASFNDYKTNSTELRWTGSIESLDWVGGIYRFSDTGFTTAPQSFFFDQVQINTETGFATNSRAIYGQISYHVTPKLEATVGARRNVDRVSGYRFAEGGGDDVPGVRAQMSDNATTSMAALSYKLNGRAMVYGRYAEGFQSGGFNGAATSVEAAETPYQPEKKRSYEVGMKATTADNRLRINGDLFYERNSNLQQQVQIGGLAVGTATVNVGSSHDEGAEIQADALVGRHASIRVNYSYLHEKYDKFVVLGEDVANNRAVAGAPRHTLNVVLSDYLGTTRLGRIRGTLDYRFISGFYQGAGWINPPPGQLSALDGWITSNSILNARLSLVDMNFGKNVEGEISLWVKNVFDRAHVDGSINFGPSFGDLIVGYYNQPRTLGLEASASW